MAFRTESMARSRRIAATAGALVAIWVFIAPGLARQQQPTFRSTVDLIAVDVQVVDGDGRPIPQLGADRFDVEIGGHRRRVASVDFIDQADSPAPSSSSLESGPAGRTAPRVYEIGVDVASFNVVESRAVLDGARQFIKRLDPADSVGIYAFPVGPKFRPSTDHAAIMRHLESIAGARESLHNTHGLSVLDVIDIVAETARSDVPALTQARLARSAQSQGSGSETLDRVISRECGANLPCANAILAEAEGLGTILQGQVTDASTGLRQLVRGLGAISGRKTLVLLSAGMPVSDRPGGRPDVGDLPKLLGQEAAGANTTIYALLLKTSFAEHQDRSPGDGREQMVYGRVLDEFTGASGGALLPIAQGTGVGQFERVLRETSSRYLLGVEPAREDRDGMQRRLTVKVKGLPRSTSVRSRQWIVVPKRV